MGVKQYGMRMDEHMSARIRALIGAVNDRGRVTELPVLTEQASNDKQSYDRLLRIMGMRSHLIRVRERAVYLLRAGAGEEELPEREAPVGPRYLWGNSYNGDLACRGCIFHDNTVGSCDYILIFGKRRPSPPGAACHVKVLGRPERKPMSMGGEGK